MLMHSSTQHPTEVQQIIAHALGVPANRVTVQCRRMGGGFGGKETQPALIAAAAAIMARATGRPVKVRLDRDTDMEMTGKRHDFVCDYTVGFDDSGRILGLVLMLASRCGYSADLSGPVNDRALLHVDNAYFLENVEIVSHRCKTNTVSNTAFRGFGGPQGMIMIEQILDAIATYLRVDPLLRRRQIELWNATQPHIRRGIALSPVKFGISFTATHFNQAGALVHVYTDGSVLLNHGGTEMGQGLFTKVAQVVAHELGLPLSAIRVSATDTSKVPNTSATAASSGADLNGKAAQVAAQTIRERLVGFAGEHFKVAATDIHFADGQVHIGERQLTFAQLVQQAYRARISLSSTGYYRTPRIRWDSATMTGQPFFYFAFGAAVSEVAIDTLTGETRLLRVDILHDVGKSLNPAIDMGQIEG